MLTYTIGEGDYKNWMIGEEEFCVQHQGKGESVFCLGNGYMGIRSAFEEPYPFQCRGIFVGGCFNSSQNETVELPNGADSCEILLILDGEFFSMDTGEVSEYFRYLNLYTGELVRSLRWQSPKGKHYQLVFRRTVSHVDLHAYGMMAEITSLDCDAIVQVITGINAQMTNAGVQHFKDGTKKVMDERVLYLDQTTTQSNITLYHCCETKIVHTKTEEKSFRMQRRKIQETVTFRVSKGKAVALEKLAVLYTSRELAEQDKEQSRKLVFGHIEELVQEGYGMLLEKSAAFLRKYWEQHDVLLKADTDKIQLALRFAQYHLLAMIPRDSHSSIAAKGLTGEGYKGHVFWDTEVFILPYYLFNLPGKAKQLLEYRMNRMEQARENARKKGYKGIMFPWESAETGLEETPLLASMDILTGKAAQVWSGIKEHHITADIAYAVWQYQLAAGDQNFMKNDGNLLIIGAALFWMSRSVYVEERNRIEILDIIGPDEYTEHVDNNAYSNYMAYYVVKKAAAILKGNSEQQKKAEEYYEESDLLEKFESFTRKLYLPGASKEPMGVIPQDDSFFDKKILDIEKYRNDNVKQTILKEYGREQVNDMQVLKQADVVMLMELLPDLFDIDTKLANWNYYEPKTIHDSSLSRAVYSVVASDCKESEKAYESFLHAIDIDMGQNPYSSDEGIHAASMGGIWLAVIRGFAGVRLQEDCLCIEPCLPVQIHEIQFSIVYRKKNIKVIITQDAIRLSSPDFVEIPVKAQGEKYCFTKSLEINKADKICFRRA